MLVCIFRINLPLFHWGVVLICRGGQGNENFVRYRYFGTGQWELLVICIRYSSKNCGILYSLFFLKMQTPSSVALKGLQMLWKAFQKTQNVEKKNTSSLPNFRYFVQKFTFGNTKILKYRAQYRECPPMLIWFSVGIQRRVWVPNLYNINRAVPRKHQHGHSGQRPGDD